MHYQELHACQRKIGLAINFSWKEKIMPEKQKVWDMVDFVCRDPLCCHQKNKKQWGRGVNCGYSEPSVLVNVIWYRGPCFMSKGLNNGFSVPES